jgi:DNA (cytosine-5)-methyltransferase 1
MEQTIFDMLYPKYKIEKPIRLIEFFAGYGSQALALKYLGVPFEHWKICEWAVKSIQAYKDIHFNTCYADTDYNYAHGILKEDLADYLFNKGISNNYNEPMTKQQIERLSEEQLKTIYNNIVITHNLVNIQQVKGKDLDIVDKDKYDYILTYSFPCQDLSLAGKGEGMSDTSTRSGMLWEVERILKELKETDSLPQVLLMENVPQVHGADNVQDFNKWQLRLEELGYKNYWQDLIATDYGIPQTRNRCFMVSILGDYNYTFPKPIPLKLKLKDLLEDNVDEKYYLSDDLMQHIQKTAEEHEEYTQYERYNGDLEMWCRIWKDKNPTLNTKCQDTKIYCNNKSLKETLEQNEIDDTCYIDTYNKKIDKEKASTITTGVSFRNNTFLAIKNATKKGYLEAEDGDGVDISSRMEHHRGTVQKDKTQTITTMGGENNGVVVNDLRIRKLTPKECFRLMGVKDEDFEKCAKNQSDSSLYHLAGDSIVVNVLMAIFSQLIDKQR